jgi:hypothetical protein
MAEDSKLDDRLTMDLSRQYRQPLVAVSVDADKCYDRINHIIMTLLLLAIGGNKRSIKAMLSCIQEMRFFQCTGRGDSDTFMGGQPSSNLLQGLCQGNGATPGCWLMLSSLMMSAYKKGGHGSTLISPISGIPTKPGRNLCRQYRPIYNASRHLQHRRSAAHSPSKPGQVGLPTNSNRWGTKSIEMLLVHGELQMSKQAMGVQEHNTTQTHDPTTRRRLQGHLSITSHGGTEDDRGVVFADRLGHKTPAGSGPR